MDFYVILGVDRDATRRDVKRAYTRLARRYHPDLNPGDREAAALYRRATEAYETLMDPERREAYDAHGQTDEQVPVEGIEFHGFDFSSPAQGTSATFSELFDSRARGRSEPEKGSDLFGDVELTFEEALHGVERELVVTRLEACASCRGSGVRRGRETACVRCQGAGTTHWRRGHMVFSKTCEQCAGSGRQRRQPCASCGGDGLATRRSLLTVHVPAGVADGARMRLPGQGNAGRRGGEPGDVYISASVAAHRLFTRDGDDLHLAVPLAVHEAALGATIDIPTLDGPVPLRVPPGTEPGSCLRVPGRGAPSPRTGRRGDLIVKVSLTLPRVDDERARRLLHELGRLDSSDVRRDLFTD